MSTVDAQPENGGSKTFAVRTESGMRRLMTAGEIQNLVRTSIRKAKKTDGEVAPETKEAGSSAQARRRSSSRRREQRDEQMSSNRMSGKKKQTRNPETRSRVDPSEHRRDLPTEAASRHIRHFQFNETREDVATCEVDSVSAISSKTLSQAERGHRSVSSGSNSTKKVHHRKPLEPEMRVHVDTSNECSSSMYSSNKADPPAISPESRVPASNKRRVTHRMASRGPTGLVPPTISEHERVEITTTQYKFEEHRPTMILTNTPIRSEPSDAVESARTPPSLSLGIEVVSNVNSVALTSPFASHSVIPCPTPPDSARTYKQSGSRSNHSLYPPNQIEQNSDTRDDLVHPMSSISLSADSRSGRSLKRSDEDLYKERSRSQNRSPPLKSQSQLPASSTGAMNDSRVVQKSNIPEVDIENSSSDSSPSSSQSKSSDSYGPREAPIDEKKDKPIDRRSVSDDDDNNNNKNIPTSYPSRYNERNTEVRKEPSLMRSKGLNVNTSLSSPKPVMTPINPTSSGQTPKQGDNDKLHNNIGSPMSPIVVQENHDDLGTQGELSPYDEKPYFQMNQKHQSTTVQSHEKPNGVTSEAKPDSHTVPPVVSQKLSNASSCPSDEDMSGAFKNMIHVDNTRKVRPVLQEVDVIDLSTAEASSSDFNNSIENPTFGLFSLTETNANSSLYVKSTETSYHTKDADNKDRSTSSRSLALYSNVKNNNFDISASNDTSLMQTSKTYSTSDQGHHNKQPLSPINDDRRPKSNEAFGLDSPSSVEKKTRRSKKEKDPLIRSTLSSPSNHTGQYGEYENSVNSPASPASALPSYSERNTSGDRQDTDQSINTAGAVVSNQPIFNQATTENSSFFNFGGDASNHAKSFRSSSDDRILSSRTANTVTNETSDTQDNKDRTGLISRAGEFFFTPMTSARFASPATTPVSPEEIIRSRTAQRQQSKSMPGDNAFSTPRYTESNTVIVGEGRTNYTPSNMAQNTSNSNNNLEVPSFGPSMYNEIESPWVTPRQTLPTETVRYASGQSMFLSQGMSTSSYAPTPKRSHVNRRTTGAAIETNLNIGERQRLVNETIQLLSPDHGPKTMPAIDEDAEVNANPWTGNSDSSDAKKVNKQEEKLSNGPTGIVNASDILGPTDREQLAILSNIKKEGQRYSVNSAKELLTAQLLRAGKTLDSSSLVAKGTNSAGSWDTSKVHESYDSSSLVPIKRDSSRIGSAQRNAVIGNGSLRITKSPRSGDDTSLSGPISATGSDLSHNKPVNVINLNALYSLSDAGSSVQALNATSIRDKTVVLTSTRSISHALSSEGVEVANYTLTANLAKSKSSSRAHFRSHKTGADVDNKNDLHALSSNGSSFLYSALSSDATAAKNRGNNDDEDEDDDEKVVPGESGDFNDDESETALITDELVAKIAAKKGAKITAEELRSMLELTTARRRKSAAKKSSSSSDSVSTCSKSQPRDGITHSTSDENCHVISKEMKQNFIWTPLTALSENIQQRLETILPNDLLGGLWNPKNEFGEDVTFGDGSVTWIDSGMDEHETFVGSMSFDESRASYPTKSSSRSNESMQSEDDAVSQEKKVSKKMLFSFSPGKKTQQKVLSEVTRRPRKSALALSKPKNIITPAKLARPTQKITKPRVMTATVPLKSLKSPDSGMEGESLLGLVKSDKTKDKILSSFVGSVNKSDSKHLRENDTYSREEQTNASLISRSSASYTDEDAFTDGHTDTYTDAGDHTTLASDGYSDDGSYERGWWRSNKK